MLKVVTDNQKESMQYISGIVDKFVSSTQETVLTIDKSNDEIHKYAIKESNNWKTALICGIIAVSVSISVAFATMWIAYFCTPVDVTAEAKAISTAESVVLQNEHVKMSSNKEGEKNGVNIGDSK